MYPSSFNIEHAQAILTEPLKRVNAIHAQIESDRKAARVRVAGAYTGLVLGAAAVVYVKLKKQA